jgi:hypothetical protein
MRALNLDLSRTDVKIIEDHTHKEKWGKVFCGKKIEEPMRKGAICNIELKDPKCGIFLPNVNAVDEFTSAIDVDDNGGFGFNLVYYIKSIFNIYRPRKANVLKGNLPKAPAFKTTDQEQFPCYTLAEVNQAKDTLNHLPFITFSTPQNISLNLTKGRDFIATPRANKRKCIDYSDSKILHTLGVVRGMVLCLPYWFDRIESINEKLATMWETLKAINETYLFNPFITKDDLLLVPGNAIEAYMNQRMAKQLNPLVRVVINTEGQKRLNTMGTGGSVNGEGDTLVGALELYVESIYLLWNQATSSRIKLLRVDSRYLGSNQATSSGIERLRVESSCF